MAANAIQILENTNAANGQHTLTIGITEPQLELGPIHGFIVNLLLFPFVGPLPEITLCEINLAGTPIVDPAGQQALWNLDDAISVPTGVTATLFINFDQTVPIGTVATYNFSSFDSNNQVLETLSFTSRVIPEPTTALLVTLGLRRT